MACVRLKAGAALSAALCHYSYTRYLPSPWEQEWLDSGAARQDSICSTMQQEVLHSQVPRMTLVPQNLNELKGGILKGGAAWQDMTAAPCRRGTLHNQFHECLVPKYPKFTCVKV